MFVYFWTGRCQVQLGVESRWGELCAMQTELSKRQELITQAFR